MIRRNKTSNIRRVPALVRCTLDWFCMCTSGGRMCVCGGERIVEGEISGGERIVRGVSSGGERIVEG